MQPFQPDSVAISVNADSFKPDTSTLTQAELAKREYAAGRTAFERGAYRQSIQQFEKAAALVNRNSVFGGEVQIWLVTAYAALDQMPEALSLCRQLTRHPSIDTRKQSRRLLFILEAPRLQTRPEWLTQIPDLKAIADGEQSDQLSSTRYAQPPKKPKRPKPQPEEELEPIDWSKINTQDNQFLWVALIGAALIMGGLWWLS